MGKIGTRRHATDIFMLYYYMHSNILFFNHKIIKKNCYIEIKNSYSFNDFFISLKSGKTFFKLSQNASE